MILSAAVSIAVLAVLFLLLRRPIADYLKKISEDNLRLLEEKNREMLSREYDRLLELNEEKMKRNEQYLESRKDIIRELIEKIHDELNESRRKIEYTEKERISEFSNLKAMLEEHKAITEKLKNSTDDLKNILSNNQLRGRYGEEIAENILKMSGFVKNLDYVANVSQETNANRPDITIRLPDKTKVNVDVKFPYQALVKYQEVEDKLEKRKYFDRFRMDVKQKIRQITSRDYINPEEKTMDFVILFVPNEMIFSLICDKLSDVYYDAMAKKVVIAGPFSFAAIVRMIRQSYDNFRIQENLQRVVELIRKFEQEFANYSKEFDKLGNRIKLVLDQYDVVSGVRTRKLNRIIDQITEKNSSAVEGAGELKELKSKE